MYSKGHGGNIYDEAINYDFSVRKPEEDVPRMESVNSRVKAKG